MARDVPSGIASALTAQGSRPGYIVEIALTNSGPLLRRSSIGDFPFGGETYTGADIVIEGLEWDGTAERNVRVTFGDTALAYWGYAKAKQFADAPIWIWKVYASAPNEAEPLFYGRCGRASRNGLVTSVECHNDSTLIKSPRTMLQYVVDPVFLLPSGSVITIGNEQVTLERRSNG